MANRPITIQGINPDNTLILSDNGNTVASRGDTITWNIGNNSGVTSITELLIIRL
jgi:outer membrane receptor for ferrienterochelin and colicin